MNRLCKNHENQLKPSSVTAGANSEVAFRINKVNIAIKEGSKG